MCRVRYNIAATLDGFIASSDHTTPWIIEDPTIDFEKLYSEFDTFIMGRKTYETMLSFGDQNPLKSKSREQVYVVSRKLGPDQYPEVTLVRGDVVGLIRGLKAREGKDIWFMGGGGLARELLEEGLLDRVEVAVMPVLIGEGIGMLDGGDGGDGGWKLVLEKVEGLKSGIVMCEYGVKRVG